VLQKARELMGEIAQQHRGRPRPAGVSERAVLIGLVGRGITASRSPVMHQREGERLGMRYTYALIDFDSRELPDEALGDVLAAAESAGFAGVNVTHPFKQAVLRHLTELDPDAAAIGAVNTIVFAAGRRVGHNTDSWGFAESFRATMGGSGLAAVTLVGAGGGGAAVAHALLQLGVDELNLHDVDKRKAMALARSLSERFGRTATAITDLKAALALSSGVVNATPVGMEKYPGAPFDAALLEARHWVADIVYFPPDTALLQRARALGCRTLPGTGMAVLQAVKAFELFTGITPDREAMTSHFGAAA
jgi:shikimate dehydrogenase